MPLLNLSFIKENVSDEPEFIAELLSLFKSDLIKDYEALNNAIEEGNFERIRTDAHKVKSGLRSLGVESCWTKLQIIEDLGKAAADLDQIRALNADIIPQIPVLLSEVDECMNSY
jgi:HPt (histidine-containing phosphotransfer) domain-containing protein